MNRGWIAVSVALLAACGGDLADRDNAAAPANPGVTTGGGTAGGSTGGGSTGGGGTTGGGSASVPVISIANAAVAEGDTGAVQLSFPVTLSKASTQAVTVDFQTVNGNALAGPDYGARNERLHFAPGETSKNISVPVYPNDCPNPDKQLSLVLSAPMGATLDTVNAATGAIADDDAPTGTFKVGAAKRVVSPRTVDIVGFPHEYCPELQFSYLGGFGLRDLGADPCDTAPAHVKGKDPIDGVGKDWHVRVMIVELSATNRMAFVTLDAVGAGNIIQEGVRRAINTQTGIPKDNVIFGQSHSHAGADLQGLWGGMPFEWRQYLYQQAAAAAKEAFDNRVEADLAYAQGIIDNPSFNSYRRNDASLGTDKRMTVIQAKRKDSGAVLSTLVQYSAHPINLGSSNRKAHPDFIAGLTDKLEADYGGTAMFYNGPIADASRNANAAGDTTGMDDAQKAIFMGQGLSMRATSLINSGMKTLIPEMNLQNRTARVPITNQLFIAIAGKGWFNGYYDFANAAPDPTVKATPAPQPVSVATTLVTRLTLGRIGCTVLEVVTIPGETSNVVGQYIRSLAPNRDMALLGLTQNSFGYLLDEGNYGSENEEKLVTEPDPLYPLGYEEGVSMGPGSVPALREQGWNPLFGAAMGTGGATPSPN